MKQSTVTSTYSIQVLLVLLIHVTYAPSVHHSWPLGSVSRLPVSSFVSKPTYLTVY